MKKDALTGGDLDQGGKLQPQRILPCPPGHHFDTATQRCVPNKSTASKAAHPRGKRRPGRTRSLDEPRALIEEMRRELEEPAKKQDELQPLGNRQEPNHDDDFLKEELALAVALASATVDKAEEVVPLFAEVLDDPSDFSEDKFEEATIAAQEMWGNTFEGAEAAVAVAINAAIFRGESRISAGILSGVPSRQVVFNNMMAVSKFRTNQFFNDQIMPALQRQVGIALDNAPAMGQPSLVGIKAILDRRLASVPYWRVVANAAASRSYHYGFLKAAQLQGFRGYRFVAVIDAVTSEICTFMDGKEWFIADAVSLMERVAQSDSIDEVKSILPWPKFDDIRNLESDGLKDLGVMVPPLHGNCRSTIVPV